MPSVLMVTTFSDVERWVQQLKIPYTLEYLNNERPFLRTKHQTSQYSYISILINCNETWLNTISSNLLSIQDTSETVRTRIMREIMRLNHEWMGIKFALNDDDKMYLARAYPAASVTRDDLSIGLQLMLQAADDFSITINAMPDIFKEVTDKVQEIVDSSKESSTRSSLKPKFCKYCGASITPDNVYCPQCGRKIE